MLTAAELAEIGEAVAGEARAAADAARMGTTGALAAIGVGRPPGSGPAGLGGGLPWRVSGPAGAFATGMILDVTRGCELALLADAAAGEMTGTRVRATMSWSGRSAPGTG